MEHLHNLLQVAQQAALDPRTLATAVRRIADGNPSPAAPPPGCPASLNPGEAEEDAAAVPSPAETEAAAAAPRGGKKQRLERREIQRRYRERVKQRQTEHEDVLQQKSQQLSTLQLEQRALRGVHHALELFVEQADSMTGLLSLHSVRPPVPSADPRGVADTVFEAIWSGEGGPLEEKLREFSKLPTELLVAKDAEFMRRLKSCMAAWEAGTGDQEALERRMFMAVDAQRRATILLTQHNPAAYMQLMHRTQPAPGTDEGIQTMHALRSIVSALELTPEQLATMRAAWVEYRSTVSGLRENISAARRAMAQLTAAETSASTTSTSLAPTQQRSQTFINTAQCMNVLISGPSNITTAYGCLASIVLSTLTLVQSARLILELKPPYRPDHVQLCELLFLDEEK